MSDGYYFCKTCNQFFDVGSIRFLFGHRNHEKYYRSYSNKLPNEPCSLDHFH